MGGSVSSAATLISALPWIGTPTVSTWRRVLPSLVTYSSTAVTV